LQRILSTAARKKNSLFFRQAEQASIAGYRNLLLHKRSGILVRMRRVP
jgi:hypothetical protein